MADGIVVKDPLNPKQTTLRTYSFMVDTGAESSLVREVDRDILTRTSEFAGLTVHDIGGTVQPLGGGFIDISFPGFRVRNRS